MHCTLILRHTATHMGHTTMTITSNMTLEELQQHLRNAHAKIGFAGRFAFTIDQSTEVETGKGHGGCYITHWFRPTPHAFEDCKAVGSGSAEECLQALERYVASYARPMTDEEVGRTLGIVSEGVI